MTQPPINFVDLSPQHAQFLASTLLASRTDGALVDECGKILCKVGTVVEWRSVDALGDLPVVGRMPDLVNTTAACGLDPQNPVHSQILYGFRNPILRAARGESWVPEVIRRLVIKTYQADIWPEGQGSAGCMALDAGPKSLRIASATSGRKGVIGVHVDAGAFRQLLANSPTRKEWLAFVRSPALRFSEEPLWLRIALKLI